MTDGFTDVSYYHHVIRALHSLDNPDPKQRWQPHDSQILIGQALFVHNCKNIFIQCGRKFGKTEIIIYCLWRYALLNPGSACYYLCPVKKQAKEIIWDVRDKRGRLRLKEFASSEFIERIDEDELRIVFKNGSFIKVDGSDNADAWAGISPHFLVLDEFRSFRPEFLTVMNPNRATFDAPMIVIGTPPEQVYIEPEVPHQYIELAKEIREDMLAGGPSFWIKRPSWANPDPTIQAFLATEKMKLFRRGRSAEWYREYGAECVADTARKIFPNFIADSTLANSHVLYHSALLTKMAGI